MMLALDRIWTLHRVAVQCLDDIVKGFQQITVPPVNRNLLAGSCHNSRVTILTNTIHRSSERAIV